MTTLKLSFLVFIVCICKLIHLTQIYLLFQLFCKYHLTLNHIHKNNPVFHLKDDELKQNYERIVNNANNINNYFLIISTIYLTYQN